jgi:hypothetical protein
MTARMLSVCILFAAFAVAAPCQDADGLYLQAGVLGGGILYGGEFRLMAGLKAGAGYGLSLGAGTLALGAEAGFAQAGTFTMIPASLSAAYDIPLGSAFSVGAGILAGAYFVTGNSIGMSPLFGGRLRGELSSPRKRAGLYIGAGADLALESRDVAVMPVIETGLRLRPGK